MGGQVRSTNHSIVFLSESCVFAVRRRTESKDPHSLPESLGVKSLLIRGSWGSRDVSTL
jgi:hypothetical protein